MTRILLVGRTGQVGSELVSTLAPLGTVTAPTRSELDLSRPDTIPDFIRALRPSIIVNAGAYTAVDKAEREPDLAHTVNAAAPGALAHAAREAGALMVHYSTDYVFDGTRPGAYAESDAPNPLGVYGRTKLEGERHIRASGCRHLLFRTSWVYAARGGNFARTMLRLAEERDSLRVIDDQFGAPTGAELIADVTAHALRAARTDVGLAGTYHLAAAGETTWHGYARHVITRARQAGRATRAGPDAILPITTDEFPTPARRPGNSRLDTSRLREAFDLVLPHWTTGVDRMLAELLAR